MNITLPLNISVEIGATALYVYCEDNMQSAMNVFTLGLNVL